MPHAVDVLEGLRPEQRDRVFAEGAGRFDREKALKGKGDILPFRYCGA